MNSVAEAGKSINLKLEMQYLNWYNSIGTAKSGKFGGYNRHGIC